MRNKERCPDGYANLSEAVVHAVVAAEEYQGWMREIGMGIWDSHNLEIEVKDWQKPIAGWAVFLVRSEIEGQSEEFLKRVKGIYDDCIENQLQPTCLESLTGVRIKRTREEIDEIERKIRERYSASIKQTGM